MPNLLSGARTMVSHIADRLQAGLSVELWNGEVLPLGPGARDDIRIVIASPDAVGRLMRSPRLMTLVELCISGAIDIKGGSPLEALGRWDHMRALALRRTVDRKLMLKAAWPFLFARETGDGKLSFGKRVLPRFGRGRDDGAMIEFHYDVSNAFYELFLDPEMQYSAGYFADLDTSLADAQTAKLDRICRKLQLGPADHLLDIGCGWGGLACHAAQFFGCTVHGVTLSKEQHDAARERARSRGLEKLVTIELRDFRTIATPGAYSKIVQVGMFEHVGIDNHDSYFGHVHQLLKGGGLYLHQASTRRAPHDLKTYRKRTPYMKVLNRYIFPGGELDYLGLTITNMERNAFEVRDVETMREHYYLSLKSWSEALYRRREEAIEEVGPERVRLWLLYFALSCVGFWRGAIYDFQTVAQKRQTGLSGLPLARADSAVDAAPIA
ncbi:MAG: cyclopropane-fatty-acyl-phospholipid synthase family protein [Pseudomonadota bacterium]|nr:cyclopropane-fatty-acyl-phospholipid synthase family protein [Pseudomonadota bacterium]